MATIAIDPRIPFMADMHELERKRSREARRATLTDEDKGLVYWQDWCDDRGLEKIPTREQMVEFTREFVLPMEAAINERLRHDPTSEKPFCGRTVFIEPVLRYRARMQSRTAQSKSPQESTTRDGVMVAVVKSEDSAARISYTRSSSERSKRQATNHLVSSTTKKKSTSRTAASSIDISEVRRSPRSSASQTKQEPISPVLPLLRSQAIPSLNLPTPTRLTLEMPLPSPSSESKPKAPQPLRKSNSLNNSQETKRNLRSLRSTNGGTIKDSEQVKSPLVGSKGQESRETVNHKLPSLPINANGHTQNKLVLRSSTASSADPKNDSFPLPIRDFNSIQDIWTEWTQGWKGEPSMESLIKIHGRLWREPKHQKHQYHFYCRDSLVVTIRDVVDRGVVPSAEHAIQILEKSRGNLKLGSFKRAGGFKVITKAWGVPSMRKLGMYLQ